MPEDQSNQDLSVPVLVSTVPVGISVYNVTNLFSDPAYVFMITVNNRNGSSGLSFASLPIPPIRGPSRNDSVAYTTGQYVAMGFGITALVGAVGLLVLNRARRWYEANERIKNANDYQWTKSSRGGGDRSAPYQRIKA